jgi:aryl-alcohol dehydrogenase-like predicted oxidoreductase
VSGDEFASAAVAPCQSCRMEFVRLACERDLPRPVSLQNAYSLVNRTYETGLAEIDTIHLRYTNPAP